MQDYRAHTSFAFLPIIVFRIPIGNKTALRASGVFNPFFFPAPLPIPPPFTWVMLPCVSLGLFFFSFRAYLWLHSLPTPSIPPAIVASFTQEFSFPSLPRDVLQFEEEQEIGYRLFSSLPLLVCFLKPSFLSPRFVRKHVMCFLSSCCLRQIFKGFKMLMTFCNLSRPRARLLLLRSYLVHQLQVSLPFCTQYRMRPGGTLGCPAFEPLVSLL